MNEQNENKIQVHQWEPPKYWQSLEHRNGDPATLAEIHREFISSPLQDEKSEDGFERREFLKLMGASAALATLAGCVRRPVQKIVPFAQANEYVVPGIPNYYASTCTECVTPHGILVKTRESRPIKIEGNPDHYISMGGTTARCQASILGLYDQDRAQKPAFLKRGTGEAREVSWADLDKKVIESLGGKKHVRVLTGAVSGPGSLGVIRDFLSGFGDGKNVMFEALGADAQAEGQALSYGTAVVPRYNLDRADVIVSFGADFLGAGTNQLQYNRQFAKRRKLNRETKSLSKLFVFEPQMSLTGTNADVRYPVKPQNTLRVALALAHEVGMRTGGVPGGLENFSPEKVQASTGVSAEVIKQVAALLVGHRGHGLVMGADISGSGDLGIALEIVASFINSACGNEGSVVDGVSSPTTLPTQSYKSLLNLVSEMRAGAVEALIISGTNPVYSAPNSGFAEALAKVPVVIYAGDRVDETGAQSDILAAGQHGLESWGDAEPHKGVFSLLQPTIQPLYDTRQFQDSLITWARALGNSNARLKAHDNFHDYLQAVWKESVASQAGGAGNFNSFWEKALKDGIVDVAEKHVGRERSGSARNFHRDALSQALKVAAANPHGDAIQMVLIETTSMGDGRFANNPWLQELPDPVTKVTWENAAIMSKKTADSLKVSNGDVVKITASVKKAGGADESVSLEMPVYIQPGQADQVVATAVGWGRSRAGQVGNKNGSNAFKFMSLGSSIPTASGLAVEVSKTGRFSQLACTQTHHAYDEHFTKYGGKQEGENVVIREASLTEYLKNNSSGNEEKVELTTLWPVYEYRGYRWGMGIDLNSCTGCSACVIACQAENNVPVVGKDQVRVGREMHWMRIDRYYSGNPEQPMTIHQPMLCQHCENAPCETVCPVLATVHSDEGLNEQIYNRCVGTRYCSNNCPYKVRRFNWFNFNYYDREGLTTPQQAWNPDVSVRFRGVMEKCTFCIQRIKEAKGKAKDKGVKVTDKDLKTACQQGCPTDAIIFGDMNDPNSLVSQWKNDPRAYRALDELNVKSSISYLTKIRNVDSMGEHDASKTQEGKGRA